MAKAVKVTVRNIYGKPEGLDIFKYFDDGVRKRLPKMVAKELLDELIKNIDENKFNFELSRKWTSYKKRVGADDRPFVMFGYYKNAIQVITRDGHLSVGFKSSSIHPRAKVSMSLLARQLEFGDLARGLPARPLWRFTMEEFLTRKDLIGKLIKKSLDEGPII